MTEVGISNSKSLLVHDRNRRLFAPGLLRLGNWWSLLHNRLRAARTWGTKLRILRMPIPIGEASLNFVECVCKEIQQWRPFSCQGSDAGAI